MNISKNLGFATAFGMLLATAGLAQEGGQAPEQMTPEQNGMSGQMMGGDMKGMSGDMMSGDMHGMMQMMEKCMAMMEAMEDKSNAADQDGQAG